MSGLLLRMVGVPSRKVAAAIAGATPELGARLRDVAHQFLRAGGRFTAADWAAMSTFERSAAEVAGDDFEAERTAERTIKLVAAMRSPLGLAEAGRILDGGAAVAALTANAEQHALAHAEADVLAALRTPPARRR